MNFLAHTLLAGERNTDRIGGLMGDFIKGPLPAGLPPDLASGVALHRAIDTFADRHPAFVASRARISTSRKRFSGVLVDLFYDHLLALKWPEYGQNTLKSYTSGIYAALQAHSVSLPDGARDIADRMHRQDWLFSYSDITAVGRAIDRMAIYRIRRTNPLAGGIDEFLADAEGFATDFRKFLPDAMFFAAEWRARRDQTTR